MSIMPPPGPQQPPQGLPFAQQPQFTPPPSVDPASLAGGQGMGMGMQPPASGVEAPEPDTTSSLDEAPRRRRRSLKLDNEKVAADVLERATDGPTVDPLCQAPGLASESDVPLGW